MLPDKLFTFLDSEDQPATGKICGLALACSKKIEFQNGKEISCCLCLYGARSYIMCCSGEVFPLPRNPGIWHMCLRG